MRTAFAVPMQANYNVPVNDPSPARQALCRLLVAAWDPQGLPAAESIPWPDVLRQAEPNSVGALLFAVTRPIHGSMPPAVRDALEQALYRTVVANTRCLHELAQVRTALSQVGAPYLLLKGAALSEALYGDAALRRIGDIDLAVRAEDVDACRNALLGLGYTSGQVEHRTGSLLSHSNQELFDPPGPYRTAVELHWHVLDVPYYLRHLPMDWFWENSESYLIAGQPFQVLNPEANVIYLPAHLALHHRFDRLQSLLDLALLIVQNRDRLDWEKVGAAAQSFDLLTVLRETLDCLAGCWPSLPLGEARRLLRALKPSRMDERLFRLLTAESRNTTLNFYTTLVSLPDLAARARFAWFNVFPQPAYMTARYPIRARWQIPYWYLYRLAGGLERFARILPGARQLDRRGPTG